MLFVVILITALVTVFSLLRTPSVQVLAGRLAADYLSARFHISLYIDKVRISDRLRIKVEGLQLLDHQHAPLLELRELSVQLNDLDLRGNRIGLGPVRLSGGGFYLVKYAGDTLLNLDHALKNFSAGSPDTAAAPAPWTITCSSLSLEDVAFGYTDEARAGGREGMDFDDLLITAINVSLEEVALTGDSVSAVVEHLACHEKSGFSLLEFAARVQVSNSGIRTDDLFISTNNSTLDLDLDFLYADYASLGYFLDSVYINAEFRNSLLTLQDVGYFAPELMPMDDPVMISGVVDGFISDFSADQFNVNFGQFTEFEGDISMRGLPDFDSTFIVADIRRMTTHPEDITAFSLPSGAGELVLPDQVKELGFVKLSGNYSGRTDRFRTRLDLKSDLGDIQVTGRMHHVREKDSVSYAADIAGSGIDLGKLFQTAELGTTDLDLEIQGHGMKREDLDATVSGWIENFIFKNHHYDRIILGGNILADSYHGRVIILDEALSLSFDGLVNADKDNPVFDFTIDLQHARFYEMNLSDKSDDMDLSGQITGDFSGIDPDHFRGAIRLRDMKYLENDRYYTLDNFELTRTSAPGRPDHIRLRSDYADGEITGEFTFPGLIRAAGNMIFSREELEDPGTSAVQPANYANLSLHLKDINPLLEIMLPSLSVDTGAVITGEINEDSDLLKIGIETGGFSFSGFRFDRAEMTGATSNGRFFFDAAIGTVVLQETADTVSLSLENFGLHAETSDDTIMYTVLWDNFDSVLTNKALISGMVLLSPEGRIEARIKEANADFNRNIWHMTGENTIVADSGFLTIHDLNIFKGREGFTIDGTWSEDPRDTLGLMFRDWSLANFNPLLKGNSITLGGLINGRLGITRGDSLPNVFAGINIGDFEFNDVYFGEAEIISRWIEADSAMKASVNIYSRGELADRYRILNVDGLYYPFSDSRNFDFQVRAQNLDISVLEPMLTSFSSHLSGFASGGLTLEGTNDKPALTGSLKLQRAEMAVDYLGVTYSFANEVVFSRDAIKFSELKVYDPQSNQAVLSGGITHSYFSDMRLDLNIRPEQFQVINLNRYQNEVFYGKAFATGEVSLTGPFENLTIRVDARTDKGTNVFLPISYSVDVSDTDFIVFINEEDTARKQEQGQVRVEGLSLDIAMDVTRDADIQIFLPSDIGYIKAAGAGQLRLGVDPNGYLTLSGSYTIQSGLFVFSLEQLVSRRFEILEGSKISWTGDINDADVNIVARYRLRTSLDGLGISMIDPDAAAQKVIVNTDIRMTGNLFNPDLGFGITFPNMPEQTRQAVYAVLDTTDLGLMNQQAISLLVLGSFSSTGSGGTNPVNPAAIVSNTLSSMLSQISNDFNIGINYVPGDRVSDEQLEVALSTQLLNDRLIIDGNFDVTGSSASSQKTSAIVGDFNIEYKLTPDGRFRVKAFNRSNDLSLYTQYAPYTQGVGIFYRKEFNSIQDFFGRKRKIKTGENDVPL